MSSKNARRFAAAVLEAFRAAGHYTDEEIGEAGGPSTTTLTKFRKVAAGDEDMQAPRAPTFRKIDTAAGWVKGSARGLWELGTSPLPVPPKSEGLRSDDVRRLAEQIARLDERDREELMRELKRKGTA